MGCHTWWYRLLQEDEAKYFIDAWIKHCDKAIEEPKNIILNKDNKDSIYSDIVKDLAKKGYYDLDKEKYFNYLVYDDYHRFRFIKEYLKKSNEPYIDLNAMLYNYPEHCPFNLISDNFSDKVYIGLFSDDRNNELLNKNYYRKLEEYEVKYNHHDVFRIYEYGTWVNTKDELKTLLNSGKVHNISEDVTNENILGYYQEIIDKFGDCKIKFG